MVIDWTEEGNGPSCEVTRNMRDDLLDAKACVDWAVAQLDPLKARLIAWREATPYSFSDEEKPYMGKKIIRFADVKLPDPIINA